MCTANKERINFANYYSFGPLLVYLRFSDLRVLEDNVPVTSWYPEDLFRLRIHHPCNLEMERKVIIGK